MFSLSLKSPKGIEYGNLREDFRRFKQEFEIYMTVTGLESQSDEIKLAYLLNFVGKDGLLIYNALDLKKDEKKSYKKVLEAFEARCCPKRSIILERFIFNQRVQHPNESFFNFYIDLRNLASPCEYGELEDGIIRDRIVVGIRDDDLREQLLMSSNTSLDKIVEMCENDERWKIQAQELQNNRSAVSRRGRNSTRQETNKTYLCKKCNKRHVSGNCPAFGKRCNFCNGLNHFVVGCKKKKRNLNSNYNSEDEPYIATMGYLAVEPASDSSSLC